MQRNCDGPTGLNVTDDLPERFTVSVAKAKKKCFSPARWGSRKLIRASSFYTSNINVLLSYVAIVSRLRYVWGMENNSGDYRR